MPLKFAANLTFMFNEHDSLVKRYSAAKQAGFHAVECAFPYGETVESLVEVKEKENLKQVLINMYPGDSSKGDKGLAAIPGRQQDFKKALDLSITYANALKCKKLHIMAGIEQLQEKSYLELMEKTYIENLKYAAEKLAQEGILALIEPINSRYSLPGYFLNTQDQALKIIEKVNNDNLKIQMDIFHLQIMEGNLTENIKRMWPFIGHIQISQVPHRNEPDSKGEINYQYILGLFEELNYLDYIGCEYIPKGNTLEGLHWIKNYCENT